MKPNTYGEIPQQCENRILASLSSPCGDWLQTLEPVQLPAGTVLYEPDETIEHVYFLTDALVSIISMASRLSVWRRSVSHVSQGSFAGSYGTQCVPDCRYRQSGAFQISIHVFVRAWIPGLERQGHQESSRIPRTWRFCICGRFPRTTSLTKPRLPIEESIPEPQHHSANDCSRDLQVFLHRRDAGCGASLRLCSCGIPGFGR